MKNITIIHLSRMGIIHNKKYTCIHINFKKNDKKKYVLDEDGSDCARDMFWCENGPCIMNSLRCNGRVDCPHDDSDELDCRKFVDDAEKNMALMRE